MRVSVKPIGHSLIRFIIAFCSAIILAAVSVLFLSKNPTRTLYAFFISPFAKITNLFTILENAAPLAICACGVAFTFRAGLFSLAGESQVYLGSMITTLVALSVPQNLGFVGILVAIFLGSISSALLGIVPAFGKKYANADILLVSILLSQGLCFIIDWAISNPFKNPNGNLIAMSDIPKTFLLTKLSPPSILTISPVLAIIVCILMSLYFEKMKTGIKHDLYGLNSTFAKVQGFDISRLSYLPLIVAGFCHGFAGSLISLGTKGTTIRGMTSGLGWTAIGVSLISGSKPELIPFAAILFSWLDTGARLASFSSELPPDAGLVIKALVIIIISAKPGMKIFNNLIKREKK